MEQLFHLLMKVKSKIYMKFFYLGVTIEPEIKEAILMSIEESKYLSYGALDQWRLAFMLICQTPYWQIL